MERIPCPYAVPRTIVFLSRPDSVRERVQWTRKRSLESEEDSSMHSILREERGGGLILKSLNISMSDCVNGSYQFIGHEKMVQEVIVLADIQVNLCELKVH